MTATNTVAGAEAALADLRARMVAGDQTVTPADFTRARAAVDFAKARQAAEEEAARQREERERRERQEAAKARLEALDTAKPERARQRLDAALDGYVAAVAEAWRELDDLGAELSAAGLDVQNTPTGLHACGRTVRRAPLQMAIHTAAAAAVKRHLGGRHRLDLNSPPD